MTDPQPVEPAPPIDAEDQFGPAGDHVSFDVPDPTAPPALPADADAKAAAAHEAEVAAMDANRCKAESGDIGGTIGWICTRESGHDGRHVAGDGEVIKAVWS